MNKVLITVVKKALFEDIAESVLDTPAQECTEFEVGDKFIISDFYKVPSNFCPWAWADIQRDIAMILYGATPEPKLKNPNSIMSCCTCGLHPVVYKIELIEED